MAKSTIDIRLAKRLWSNLSATAVKSLITLLEEHGFSVANGDVLYIDNRWYVTHAGLLRLARRRRCSGISVYPLPGFCDPVSSRWAFAATVYKNCARRGFTGHGDAD